MGTTNLDINQLKDGTDGELITWDSAGAPDTVAAGTADQVLTSNGAGAAPTFQDAGGGGATHKFGLTSRTLNTSSGNQTIAHGLGATPSYVKLKGVADRLWSEGNYDGSTNRRITQDTDSTSGWSGGENYILYLVTAGGDGSYCTCTVDGTNITLAWTKTGDLSNTAQILWEVW